MKISFFNSQQYDGNAKATIHTTGKLGFTEAAIRMLKLSEKKGIRIGRNSEVPGEKDLYVELLDELSEDAFKINKAGLYYYLNTKSLFDSMGFPYRNKRVSFDIIPIEVSGMSLYKFTYKEK